MTNGSGQIDVYGLLENALDQYVDRTRQTRAAGMPGVLRGPSPGLSALVVQRLAKTFHLFPKLLKFSTPSRS